MSDLSSINSWLQPQKMEPISKHQEFQKEDRELRRVSKEFEGILVRTMIKEGFKSARDMGDNEDEDHGSKQFMDMAYDQMANHIAENVGFGLSETIYESLKKK